MLWPRNFAPEGVHMTRMLQLAALSGALALGVAIGQATADQPRMHAALDALQMARAELYAANADKGGHRVNALRLVNEAIREVRAGIAYDRRN
jgi:hypothetical protein